MLTWWPQKQIRTLLPDNQTRRIHRVDLTRYLSATCSSAKVTPIGKVHNPIPSHKLFHRGKLHQSTRTLVKRIRGIFPTISHLPRNLLDLSTMPNTYRFHWEPWILKPINADIPLDWKTSRKEFNMCTYAEQSHLIHEHFHLLPCHCHWTYIEAIHWENYNYVSWAHKTHDPKTNQMYKHLLQT